MDVEERQAQSLAEGHAAKPIEDDAATASLKQGPRGALFVAGISVALLFIGWLAFYFLLFLPRGPIG